jgi:hypothetical protein
MSIGAANADLHECAKIIALRFMPGRQSAAPNPVLYLYLRIDIVFQGCSFHGAYKPSFRVFQLCRP